jgi:hypothetical protein
MRYKQRQKNYVAKYGFSSVISLKGAHIIIKTRLVLPVSQSRPLYTSFPTQGLQ